jgi:hypothetical protein
MPQNPVADEEDWLTTRETAELMRVAIQTLANWRAAGLGPPYWKLSDGRAGRVRYLRRDVLKWRTERQVAA